ncbi:MAG: TetR/AcrR family transcriptional regulator [Panacagrimonas sp.]
MIDSSTEGPQEDNNMASTRQQVARTKRRAQTEAPSDLTRKYILKAAAKLFRDQGYVATTLRQIADASGIQAGSIYYHFRSKDEILAEILDVGIDEVQKAVVERLSRLPANASARQKIAAAIEGHLMGLLQHGDFTSASIRVYGQLPAELKRSNQARRASYSQFWDGLLAEAGERGELRKGVDLHIARLVILGAVNWTVEWYDAKRGSVEAVAKEIAFLISGGTFGAQVGKKA